MDHMRRNEIIGELTGYQHKIRLGSASVTVGDVVQLISDNERLSNERTFWHQKWRRDWQALNEARTEVERLTKDMDAGTISIRAYERLQKDLQEALAEVERLNGSRGDPASRR